VVVYGANMPDRHAKLPGYNINFHTATPQLLYSPNLCIRQPMCTSNSPMLDRILHVRLSCIPPQILQSIIRSIPIVVTAFHPIRTRPYKCFKDEAVDVAWMLIIYTA
jgi:hypothetical protein